MRVERPSAEKAYIFIKIAFHPTAVKLTRLVDYFSQSDNED
jgi:hypothetical protein